MEHPPPQWRAAYGYALAIISNRDAAREAADRVLDQVLTDAAAGEPARSQRWWLRSVRRQALELAREREEAGLTSGYDPLGGGGAAVPLTRFQREVTFLRNVLDLSTEETADVVERPSSVVRWTEQRTVLHLVTLRIS
jgi:hypothetical protein